MPEQPLHPLRRSPLEHMTGELAAGSVPGPDGVTLTEVRFARLINLRGDAGDPRFRQATGGVLGFDLPLQPNRFLRRGQRSCLWLGPDERLVVDEADAGADPSDRFGIALAGLHASIMDLSAAYAALDLAGVKAPEVLAKGCPLDLHPREFRPGHCAQSNLARTQAIVALEDEAPSFRVYVRRSLAEYLAQWLLDAMREYGVSGRT
jgi:sarcosine oxidase subunit gamma